MSKPIYQAALTGLLHDIGKFLLWAKQSDASHAVAGQHFVEQYLPASLKILAQGVQYHHQPNQLTEDQQIVQWVRLADQLVSAPSRTVSAPLTHLRAILGQLHLTQEPLAEADKWVYHPAPLSMAHIFPTTEPITEVSTAYQALWTKGLQQALNRWQAHTQTWPEENLPQYVTTLLALLQQYLAFVPATSPDPSDEDDMIWPDVPLFDHLKTTAALAACLVAHPPARYPPAAETDLALFVRVDLSGIQTFIYRVTRPATDADFGGVAKRLRGRSFYLSLLTDLLADWLCRELAVPTTNVLLVGGGKFDLLIPLDRRTPLEAALETLEQWLLEEFFGELSINSAIVPLKQDDFGDMQGALKEAIRQLEQHKQQAWHSQLDEVAFFQPDLPPDPPANQLYHACNVCHLTPLDDSGTCPLCDQHKAVGGMLPRASHVALVYGDTPSITDKNDTSFWFKQFGVQAVLLPPDKVDTLLDTTNNPLTLITLLPSHDVDEGDFIRPANPRVAQRFLFLGHTASVATTTFPRPRTPPNIVDQGPPSDRKSDIAKMFVFKDDILDFDALANLSTGSQRLGVMKADVDNLRLLFEVGLVNQTAGLTPSLSRITTLSRTVDLFFAGWLNSLCHKLFEEWQQNSSHEWRDRIEELFYILYAGGDDLLVIGPWNHILELAHHLRTDFAAYACHNPNVTLSAGVVQVKPHYPVQRFVELVNQAEQAAKDAGRNHITLFDQAVPWPDEKRGFAWLLTLAKKLTTKVESQEIPRTLLHDLGRIYRIHLHNKNSPLKPMWRPRTHYTLARRISPETYQEISDDLFRCITDGTILVPVSYASLITRKE